MFPVTHCCRIIMCNRSCCNECLDLSNKRLLLCIYGHIFSSFDWKKKKLKDCKDSFKQLLYCVHHFLSTLPHLQNLTLNKEHQINYTYYTWEINQSAHLSWHETRGPWDTINMVHCKNKELKVISYCAQSDEDKNKGSLMNVNIYFNQTHTNFCTVCTHIPVGLGAK